jgi:hypothetical protein
VVGRLGVGRGSESKMRGAGRQGNALPPLRLAGSKADAEIPRPRPALLKPTVSSACKPRFGGGKEQLDVSLSVAAEPGWRGQ